MFKKIFLIAVLIFTGFSYSQTIYEVEPGTKGNQIIITLANESKLNKAENVKIQLIKSSSELKFNKQEQTINRIDESKETDAAFTFDINLIAPANKKDTIEFSINGNGIALTKSFIIEYSAPKSYSLEQNYPNPFNPTTIIRYSIPAVETQHAAPVQLIVYDILGNVVTTLVKKEQSPGNYEVKFDASNFASGTYIYRLTVGDFVSVKKLMLLK